MLGCSGAGGCGGGVTSVAVVGSFQLSVTSITATEESTGLPITGSTVTVEGAKRPAARIDAYARVSPALEALVAPRAAVRLHVRRLQLEG